MQTLFEIGTIYVLDPDFAAADVPCSIAGSGMDAANTWQRRVWTGEMLTELSLPGSRVATKCFHVTGASYSDALVILRQRADGKS
jgi:hypothetical protein